MRIPKQARRAAKELFRSATVNGVLDDNAATAAVQRVLKEQPRGYTAVLSHFQRLVKLDLDRRAAVVETPQPLAPELQERIRSRLTESYGAGLNISFAQNPALIGGMRVKVGSDVYDGSIQAKLAALQNAF